MRLATCVLTLLVMATGGGTSAGTEPRVEITPILHTGDPAPGIPDATMVYLFAPQIDGAGNVLIDGFYLIEGETSAHNGLWYGGAGSVELVSYAGMQAPDLPPGVEIYFMGGTWLAENGGKRLDRLYRFSVGTGDRPRIQRQGQFRWSPGRHSQGASGWRPGAGTGPGDRHRPSERKRLDPLPQRQRHAPALWRG